MSEIAYKYNEGKVLAEVLEYINKTYGQHYAGGKIQTSEFISDQGHGEGFLIGNIIKYAARYGKKGGKNRQDLLKVAHYAIMMLNHHDKEEAEKEAALMVEHLRVVDAKERVDHISLRASPLGFTGKSGASFGYAPAPTINVDQLPSNTSRPLTELEATIVSQEAVDEITQALGDVPLPKNIPPGSGVEQEDSLPVDEQVVDDISVEDIDGFELKGGLFVPVED